MTKAIFNRELAQQAFDMLKPQIEDMLQKYASKTHMSVVISAVEAINPNDPQKSFKDNCILVTGFGDTNEWELDYEHIALSKAEKSVRTGLNSAIVEPQYFYEGDTPYWGSFVLDGIVVGCSGVEGFYDEMFATWIAATIKAMCKKRVAELPKGQHFI